jgi:hypothetical protein
VAPYSKLEEGSKVATIWHSDLCSNDILSKGIITYLMSSKLN